MLEVRFRPLIRGLSISSKPFSDTDLDPFSFRPLIRGLSISSLIDYFIRQIKLFPSPHPGIINFFGSIYTEMVGIDVSVPSSGDYQFLLQQVNACSKGVNVSVPSSGDYQFLQVTLLSVKVGAAVSVPSSGDYQFLPIVHLLLQLLLRFRPLIRGLSISSASTSGPW